MITDVHVHHVPAGFLRFVQDAAPCSIHLDDARGERVRLRVGTLSYDLNRTFFDIERLLARMDEMRVERALLSIREFRRARKLGQRGRPGLQR